MYTIATLHDLRQQLGLAPEDTADDLRLLGALGAATAAIERALGRRFVPRLRTSAHPVNRRDITRLSLDADLLELIQLEDASGIIPIEDIELLPDQPPYSLIQLINWRAFIWDVAPYRAISVTGVWGWHDDWPNAFRASGDSVQNNLLSSSATTITIADADGADSAHEAPRFQAGHLLKIESEYLRVLAVNAATNLLTVQRGAAGTTAAEHAQHTPISTFQPPEDVKLLCVRWAAWLYGDADQRAAGDLPASLRRGLEGLRRVGVGS